jgi:hypothetical protein
MLAAIYNAIKHTKHGGSNCPISDLYPEYEDRIFVGTTNILSFYRSFPQSSERTAGHVSKVPTASFQILSNSSHTNHLTTRRYIGPSLRYWKRRKMNPQ